MTNYEKIKAMSIAQMAEFIDDLIPNCDNCPACPVYTICLGDSHNCRSDIIKWLKETVES